MQVTSSGAAAAWDTPTIEPNLPPSVNAYDPDNPDNGGTLDSPPQQQDSSRTAAQATTTPHSPNLCRKDLRRALRSSTTNPCW